MASIDTLIRRQMEQTENRHNKLKSDEDNRKAPLAEFAQNDEQGRIHYIDLRHVIERRDWENELHLRNSAYRRVAGEFDSVNSEIMN